MYEAENLKSLNRYIRIVKYSNTALVIKNNC